MGMDIFCIMCGNPPHNGYFKQQLIEIVEFMENKPA
jgi:hypothetical protein